VADRGWEAAAEADASLAQGLNVRAGEVTNAAVRAAISR
jgi:alanine dehydrogenase